MAKNLFSKYGRLSSVLPFTFGNVYFVTNSSDAWSADTAAWLDGGEDGLVRTFTSLETAYAATSSGANDVIVLDSNTSHTIAAMMTVSKNRVHFVSTDWLMGLRRKQDQRCRVTLTATSGATNVAMLRVTGNGCSTRGIKWVQQSTVAQAITCLQDESPNGFYAENSTFHSIGSAQVGSASGSAIRLAGDGSFYKDCQIGSDTIQQATAGKVIHIATINSAVARRVIFENCEVYAAPVAGQTTQTFITVAANGDVDRYVTFKNCGFHNFNNSTGATMAVGVNSQLSDSGFLDLDNCNFFGATKVATAAVGNGNVRFVGTVPTAGTSSIAIAPTA